MSTLNRPTTTAKKSRSPIERIVVWGVILVLAVVAVFEARARFGYTNTVNALTAAIQATSEGTGLTMVDVKQQGLISGSPTVTEGARGTAVRTDSYVWKGLLKSYVLEIQVGLDDLVLGTESK